MTCINTKRPINFFVDSIIIIIIIIINVDV